MSRGVELHLTPRRSRECGDGELRGGIKICLARFQSRESSDGGVGGETWIYLPDFTHVNLVKVEGDARLRFVFLDFKRVTLEMEEG